MANLGDVLLGAANFSTSLLGTAEQQRGWQQVEEDRLERKRQFDKAVQARKDIAAEAQKIRELQYGETTFTIPGTDITLRTGRDIIRAIAPELIREQFNTLTPEQLTARRGYKTALTQPPRVTGIPQAEVAPSVGAQPSPVPPDVEQAMLSAEGVPGMAEQAVESAQGPVRQPVSAFMAPGATLTRQQAKDVESEVEKLRVEQERERQSEARGIAGEKRIEGRTAGQNKANLKFVTRYQELRKTMDHAGALSQASSEVESESGFVPDVSKVGHPPNLSPTDEEIKKMRLKRLQQVNTERGNLEVQYDRWKKGNGDPPDPSKIVLHIKRIGEELRHLEEFPGETEEDKASNKETAKELKAQRAMWVERQKEISTKLGYTLPKKGGSTGATRDPRSLTFWERITGKITPPRAPTKAEAKESAKQGTVEKAQDWLILRGIDPDLDTSD